MDAQQMLDDLRSVRVPEFTTQQSHVENLNQWFNGTPPQVPLPDNASADHIALAEMSRDPWLRQAITTIAQGIHIEGIVGEDGRKHEISDVADESGLEIKQRSLWESALAFGHSYEVAEQDDSAPSGYKISVYSPAQMISWFRDPINDTRPALALRYEKGIFGEQYYILLDDKFETIYIKDSDGWRLASQAPHGFDEIPVHRHTNVLDPISGVPIGEIEPNVGAAKRINKTTYDLLLTQHFNSWKVRVIVGLDPADDEIDEETGEVIRTAEEIMEAEKLRIRQSDIVALPGGGPNGDVMPSVTTLPETPLDGLLRSQQQQVKQLSAAMQASSPAMLGDLINLSAEALSVAETEQRRKIEVRQRAWGAGHMRIMRLIARAAGIEMTGRERVVWKDIDGSSLAQTVDALGKAHQMLKVPFRALWRFFPGVSVDDLAQWEVMYNEDDLQGALLRQQMGLLEAPEPGDAGEQAVGEV